MYTVPVADPIHPPNLCTDIEHVLAETLPAEDLSTEHGIAEKEHVVGPVTDLGLSEI
jgi:hypothetical protein